MCVCVNFIGTLNIRVGLKSLLVVASEQLIIVQKLYIVNKQARLESRLVNSLKAPSVAYRTEFSRRMSSTFSSSEYCVMSIRASSGGLCAERMQSHCDGIFIFHRRRFDDLGSVIR